MKNPNLKSKEDLAIEWAELSEPERLIIKQLSVDLLKFYKTKKHIAISNLDTLIGIQDTLSIFLKNYNKRVISLIKQGNQID
jgi:hypothetical protein